MNSLISVIVPIYKVEDYLCRCVENIINQSYKNLEIILVDDGSPDDCPKICDYYEKIDCRVKVVHKINGGLSDARNAGMRVATGEYISFVDSDDYISLDFYETLYNIIQSENSDIVECSVVKCYEDNHLDYYTDDESIKNYSAKEGLSALISENPFKQHVWNKLYKSKLIIDIPFALNKLNEDEFWTYQVFGRSKKVTHIYKTMYYYFQRESSIMGNMYNLRRLDALEGKMDRQKYIEMNYPSLSLQAKLDFFGSCIYSYQCVLRYMHGKEKQIAKDLIKDYLIRINITNEDISTINDNRRIYYKFANINFYWCCKIRNIMGIGF